MIKANVKEIVHHQLESKFGEYPKLLEHCKALADDFIDTTGVSLTTPRVRVIMPVVGWIDSGLPLTTVVDFEIHGNHLIFKITNAPYTDEQSRNIYA